MLQSATCPGVALVNVSPGLEEVMEGAEVSVSANTLNQVREDGAVRIIFILYKNHQYSRAKAESSSTMDSARLPLYCASEQASYPPSLQVRFSLVAITKISRILLTSSELKNIFLPFSK